MNGTQGNGVKNGSLLKALAPWLAIALAVVIPLLNGSMSMGSRVAVIESEIRHLQRDRDEAARDAASILHQSGDERGADARIDAFVDKTIADKDLTGLAIIMEELGNDTNKNEGLRSVALLLLRAIERRQRNGDEPGVPAADRPE